MKMNVFGFSCKTSFLNLNYHGAGTVVHLLLLKFSMVNLIGLYLASNLDVGTRAWLWFQIAISTSTEAIQPTLFVHFYKHNFLLQCCNSNCVVK